MALSKEWLLKIYQDIIMIRRFEEVIEEYAANGTVLGFIHLSIGQEACQVGVVSALKKADYKFPDRRKHGAIALYGTDPRLVMVEIFTEEAGINHKRGGFMCVNDLEYRNMGFSGIQGSTMVAYLGTAFASVCDGTDDVMAVFLGDGILGEGTYHRSMNMTTTWKPPIIYCLVDNGYAISMRYEEAHPRKELKTWGEGYEVLSLHLDGNDIKIAIEAVERAADRIRKSEGSAVLEFMTHRWREHFAGDLAVHRPEDEMSYWINDRDPPKFTRAIPLERGQVEPTVLRTAEEEGGERVQEMLEFSLENECPGVETAATCTYADREVESR